MKKAIIVLLILIASAGVTYLVIIGQKQDSNLQPGPGPHECHNLWWYDNTHRICGQKEFCAAYMYDGLKTFETKNACKKDLENMLR
jgi:hypothetical protein